ncbi:MAG: RIP metalloprotease RseP [Bacilli bacterium]|nr:RIP metalloprotease RseP [Bacilli bacterium]
MIILGILAFVLILGIIVLIHEGGHFLLARKAGILCYEFSIGMGPLIWQKKVGETSYSIRLIPIGGYVSMAGEEVESNPLNGYEYVKLSFDDDGLVTEMYAVKDLENKFPQDQNKDEFYKIVSSNLVGTKEELPGELFITIEKDGETFSYEVKRDAMVRFSKKEAFQIAPFNRLFINKTLLQRFLAVFAGPFMNFVLAWFVFFILGLCMGYSDTSTTILGEVSPNTPAFVAGLREGDKILSVGDSEQFKDWEDLSNALDKYAEGENFTGTVTVHYERDGVKAVATVNPLVYVQSAYLYFPADGTNDLIIAAFPNDNEETPSYKAGLRDQDKLYSVINEKGEEHIFTSRSDVLNYFNVGAGTDSSKFKFKVERNGEIVTTDVIETYKKQIFVDQGVEVCRVQLGISPNVTRNIGRVIIEPFKEVGRSCTVIFKTLGALFTKDSGLSIKDLSGPVGIATATVSIVEQGLPSLLNWLAILSVNIGFMNIIPLPALDGGRLAFIGYEAITKKKANPKVENIIHSIGFILLMLLFVFVAFNDVFRLF